MAAIEITGGISTVIMAPFEADERGEFAGQAARWCANNATATWLVGPRPRGYVEVIFALEADKNAFHEWLAEMMGCQTVAVEPSIH